MALGTCTTKQKVSKVAIWCAASRIIAPQSGEMRSLLFAEKISLTLHPSRMLFVIVLK